MAARKEFPVKVRRVAVTNKKKMAARKEFPVKVRRVAVTNKKTGVKYIEERRYQYDPAKGCYQYDPAKGYNVLLSSRRTGEKILEGETVTTRCRPLEGETVTTRCRPKKKPAEAAQTAELSAKEASRSGSDCRALCQTNPCRGSGLDSSCRGSGRT